MTDSSLNYAGTDGNYWSSTLNYSGTSARAYNLIIYSNHVEMATYDRYGGRSVRAVSD